MRPLLASIVALAVVAQGVAQQHDDRDAFADTPARREVLEHAKTSIDGSTRHDYFTSKIGVVVWAFDADKPEKKKARLKDVREHLELMEAQVAILRRVLPPPEDAQDCYPVIRFLMTLEDYRAFAGAQSREPTDRNWTCDLGDRGEVLGGVHGYTHRWLRIIAGDAHADGWLEEGLSVWLSGFERTRRGVPTQFTKTRAIAYWVEGQLGHIDSVDLQGFVSVGWDAYRKQPFAAELSPLFLAFLIEGQTVLGKGFEAGWSEIVPNYLRELRASHKPAKAREAAFAHVDFERLTKAYLSWIHRLDKLPTRK